jgi:hypothetical protein
MSTSTAPRFKTLGRLPSTTIETLLRPIPSAMSAALGEQAEAHARLGTAYGEATGLVVALTRKLEAAEQADAAALREAIAAGKTIPPEKAPKLREELERAERRRQAIADEVEPSANELLAAAFEVAEPVAEACTTRAAEFEAACLAALRQALDALDAAHGETTASAWASTLAGGGQVPPFTSRRSVSDGRAAIEAALRAVTADVERRETYVAEREHEIDRLNTVQRGVGVTVRLPDPPSHEELVERERGAA